MGHWKFGNRYAVMDILTYLLRLYIFTHNATTLMGFTSALCSAEPLVCTSLCSIVVFKLYCCLGTP